MYIQLSQSQFMDNLLSLQASDKYGITPLLTAIFEGHEKCVKLLLDNVSSF